MQTAAQKLCGSPAAGALGSQSNTRQSRKPCRRISTCANRQGGSQDKGRTRLAAAGTAAPPTSPAQQRTAAPPAGAQDERPREVRHSPDDPELRRRCIEAALHIKEHGWAVVEGVIPREECEAYLDGLWGWLEGLGTGIDRRDPATWTKEHWPPTFRGILNTLEVGHQDFVWRVRKHPRLTRLWEAMLGTNELLSSFDAINMLGPHNEAPPAGWLHMDQTPLRPHLACLQGIVNLVPVDPAKTGTLMVKDKSHKAHQDFFFGASGLSREEMEKIPDHYQYTREQLPYWDAFESVKLGGGAGAVFIWDSRTTHSNTAPDKITAWRHVVYACFQPRSMASARDLELKKRAWDNYSMTTHLPAENIRIYDADFAKLYPNEAKVMEEELSYTISRTRDRVEDAALRWLAGLEPYPPAEVRRGPALVELPEEQLRAMLAQQA